MYRKADSSRFAFGIPRGIELRVCPGRQRKHTEESDREGWEDRDIFTHSALHNTKNTEKFTKYASNQLG